MQKLCVSHPLVQRLHGRLRVLPALVQYVLALGAGLMAAMAHVPWALTWLYVPAVLILLTLLQQAARPWRLSGIGFCWAFGYFLPNVAWISRALMVDAEQFGWMVPVAIGVIPAYLAAFYGLAMRLLWGLHSRPLTLATGWVALWFLAELARSHLVFAFPWAQQGMIWTESLPVLQLTALVGIEGLSLLTLILPASLWLLLNDARRYGLLTLGVLALGAIGYGWGYQRLARNPTLSTAVIVRLVQPNIPQSLKWDRAQAAAHYQRLLDLSVKPDAPAPAAIIWPETASPYLLDSDMGQRLRAGAILPKETLLLTGSNRARYHPLKGKIDEIWNSLFVINAQGGIIDIYDKHHLVPFGEYVPLRSLLPLEKITAGSLDFSRGEGVRTLSLSSVPAFSPLICYEAIFPAAVVDAQARPQWLLNITNDAWYGDSAGPYQHAAITRVRAIEEGLPLVRVANTGISFISDAYGRDVVRSTLNTTFIADAPLPEAIAAPVYARTALQQRLLVVGMLSLMVVLMKIFNLWAQKR